MKKNASTPTALCLVLIQLLQPIPPAAAADSASGTTASYETILDMMTADSYSAPEADSAPSASSSPAPISPASQSLFNSLKKQRELLNGKAASGKQAAVPGLIAKVGQSIMKKDKPNEPTGYTTGPYMGPGMGGAVLVYASPKPKKVYDAKSPEIVAAYQNAKDNSASLKKIIANPEVPAIERFQLLRAFLTDQILPLRELTQVLGEKAPSWANRDFFELLIPTIPAEMLAQDALLNPERTKEMLDIYGYDARACQPGTEKEGELALSFDPQYWLTQDAQAVAHAPTADRYARSLQLTTMALILAQLQHHKQILKDGSPIQIPDACRKKISDELPKNVEVTELSELDWEVRMDALMEANGLSALSPEYQHAFASQDIGDPKSKGFLGYSPFEKIQAAHEALNYKMVAGGPRPPAIEDSDVYGELLSMRGGKIFKHLGKYLEDSEGDPDPKKISQASEKFFALQDDIRTIGAVPPSLIKRMDRSGASDWLEIVPADLRKKMQETEVLMPFPPARSPQAYRKWAGQTIQSTIDQDLLPRLRKIKDKKYRELGVEDKKLINELQHSLVDVGAYDPATITTYFETLSKRLKTSRMNERTEGDALGKFSEADLKLWDNDLTRVWHVLRSNNRLPEAKINEWELMGSQIGTNPFAGVRLAMLLELRDAEKAGNPDKIKGLQKAMADLGIEQPTTPYRSNSILSSDERTEIWRSIRDRHDEENGNLFKAQAQGINPAVTYYDVLGGLANRRVLSASDAKRAATSCLAPSKIPAYQSQASDVLQSDVGQRADLLQQIYRARGNPKLQNELYQKYAAEYELYAEVEAGVEARSSILELDAQLKKPLYHSVIREASLKKKDDLIKGLNDLCNLEPSDQEKFKKLVYSTMKAQDLLNQQLGMKSLPPSVQNELDKLSANDKKELKLAGIALALFIGSTLILTLSTGGAGAALAPALASGLSMASGAMVIGSVGISAVALPKMWLDQIPEAESRLKYVQAFEDLRLTNEQSVDKMKGEISSMKTWAWERILFSPSPWSSLRQSRLLPPRGPPAPLSVLPSPGFRPPNVRPFGPRPGKPSRKPMPSQPSTCLAIARSRWICSSPRRSLRASLKRRPSP